jgi:hypothetical protein
MNDLLADRPTDPVRRRRFQFSLRTLFVVSFLFAIFCAGIFSNYDAVRYLTLLVMVLSYPIVLLGLAIYARGFLRSFGIGAAVAFLPCYLWGGIVVFYALILVQSGATTMPDIDLSKTSSFEDGPEFFMPLIWVVVILLYSALFGFTMVITRWLIERSRTKPVPPLAAPPVPPPHIESTDAPNAATENVLR